MGRRDVEQRAREAIQIIRTGGGTVYRLAVNSGFHDAAVSKQGGVTPGAAEVGIAERILSDQFMEDLGAIPTLQQWLSTEKIERGLGPLAEELAGPRPAEARTKKQWKAYQRELRALERAAAPEGRQRHQRLSPARQAHIREVMQDRPHPFAELSVVRRRNLRRAELALGVRADWEFYAGKPEVFKLKHTAREAYPSLPHRSVEHHGEDFVQTVVEHIGRYADELRLEWVYALEIVRFSK